jgi:hypothetical protein
MSGIEGTKDLLDVLELLIQNFLNEHRFKESLLLWTQARETKFKVCQAHNLPRGETRFLFFVLSLLLVTEKLQTLGLCSFLN